MLQPRVLRKITKKVRQRVPGSILILEKIRKYYAKKNIKEEIHDFDEDLTLSLSLNEHMSSQIYWYGNYSRDILIVLKNILKPGMIFFDIGANIGEISLFAAKRVGQKGLVYAFEPVFCLNQALKKNIESNQLTQVRVIEQGLFDKVGDMPIFAGSTLFSDGTEHTGLATLFKTPSRESEIGSIKLITLDDFIELNNIQRLDFVKIDVEGSELPVLKGGIRTIKRFKPKIIMEVQEESALIAGYEQVDLLNFLENLGYSFERIGRLGKRIPITKRDLKAFQNILCLPKN